MVALYERAHPNTDPEYYQQLVTYAYKRLDKCRYGEKPIPNNAQFTAISQ